MRNKKGRISKVVTAIETDDIVISYWPDVYNYISTIYKTPSSDIEGRKYLQTLYNIINKDIISKYDGCFVKPRMRDIENMMLLLDSRI